MERRTVALADAVVSPSHYLLKWISEHQWEMPRQCHVQQNILPHGETTAVSAHRQKWQEINELVYFGALDGRAGIPLFCDALDAIPASTAAKIRQVTFLGREAIVDGIPARNYLAKRGARWSFSFEIITSLDANKTMDYLRKPYRLAVIPSLAENSPYRVLECLVADVAFVASRVGGIPELIASSDVNKVCFEPNAGALRAILCAALNDGLHPARAAVDARANERAWIALYENSLARPAAPPTDAECTAIQALSIDPNDAVALKVLARVHLKAGLHEAAHEACQLVLKQNAKDAEALQIIAETEPRNFAQNRLF